MRLWLGIKACCLCIIVILLISSIFYVQILYKPKNRQMSRWRNNEHQAAGEISFIGKKTAARRNLLESSNVYRYILGLNYWEQLTMGMRNFLSLACFGDLWNMSVVQPFTYNSRLYGLPKFKPDGNINATRPAEDLQLIFNTDTINDLLTNKFSPKMAPFETFLMNAHREVTVLHYIPFKEVHELPVMKGATGEIISARFKHSSIVDCSQILGNYKQLILKHLNEEVNKLSYNSPSPYPDFRIVKYFCVNMSVMSTPESLSSAIHLGNPDQNESVIMVNWRGTAAQAMLTHTAKGAHPNNRIAMNSSCKQKKLSKFQASIAYSQVVLSSTKRFLEAKGLIEGDYAAVHIRSEKMGLREPRFHGSFKMCLEKLSNAIDNLAAEKQNLSIVYITDYGPYSSDTCRRCGSGPHVLRWIQQQNAEQLQFDPTVYGLPADSGLAAAVEANVLASAKYLIVCGGGGFQAQVVGRFYRHPNAGHRITRVCTEDSDFE